MMTLSQYGKIPLKNLAIYNGVYDLQFSTADMDLVSNLFTVLKDGDFEYVVGPAVNKHDYVLKFAGNYDQVLTLFPTDPIAAQNGYKVIRLAHNRYYLKFIPSPADIQYLNIFSDFEAEDESEHFVFNSMDELRDHIFKHDIDLLCDEEYLKPKQIEVLYWLCNKLPQYNEKLYTNMDFVKDMSNDIYYILDVLLLPNDTRIAIYVKKLNQYKAGTYYGVGVETYSVTPDDAAYNWTDPKRYFSHMSDKTRHGKVYYVGPNPIIPDEEIITRYLRGNKFLAIENQTLALLEKREQRRLVEEVALDKAKETIKAKLQDKAQTLNKGNTFTYNDIAFFEHGIEYEGQRITSTAVKVCDLLDNYRYNIEDDVFNFENVYEGFCREIEIQGNNSHKKINATIGNVDIDFQAIQRTNKAGIKATTNRINGMRINKDDS